MSTQLNIVRLSAASLFLLTMPACSGQEFESDAEWDVESDEELEFRDGPIIPEETLTGIALRQAACPADRQIAERWTGPLCPDLGGWNGKRLFAPLAASDSNELQRYCAYTWNKSWGEVPNLSTLEEETAPGGSLESFSSDCEVVFAQAEPEPEPESDKLWDVLDPNVEDLFHQSIGRVDGSILMDTESDRWPVLVAVVDSVPEPAPDNPRSEHGELMVAMINDIACPNGVQDCSVMVKRSLGLPRYSGAQVDPHRGGYWGSQADIARSIFETVEMWRTHDWGEKTPKLIINLSVGWEGAFFDGSLDADNRFNKSAVKSVATVIEWSRCLGAVVIASAGNQGHLCTTDALSPGGWEKFSAPDAARCAELSVSNPVPVNGNYEPLVYSVGGLAHNDEPMPGTRVDGMPRLAATSSHAPAGGDSTVLTGTSVSAAAVTGAAALAWSYAPEVSAGKVMGNIYGSGEELGGMNADYIGPGTVNSAVHKLDVCAALEAVCNRPLANCQFTSPLDCSDGADPLTLSDIFNILRSLTETDFIHEDHTNLVVGKDSCQDVCGLPATSYIKPGAYVEGDECPASIEPTAPYSLPQPTEVACPNCTLDVNDNVVYASLDPSYDDLGIEDVTVTVFDGSEFIYSRLGSIALTSKDLHEIRLDFSDKLLPLKSATISIAFTGNKAPLRPVTDDLLIR